MAKRVIYQRTDCKWAWRLVADNGQIIAVDGNQGYENEADARDMADKVITGGYSDANRLISKRDGCA